jgi:hypothetical protein
MSALLAAARAAARQPAAHISASAAAVLLRRLASSSSAGVNGAPPSDGGAGDGAPTASVGGWYSSDSIERRLRKMRSRPPGAPGRTKPPPSEEDFWLASGAPGYTEDHSTASAAAAAAAADARPTGAAARLAQAAAAAEAAAQWAPLPLVRVATGSVAVGNLSAFVRTYELLALPAYAACPGCLGARLLLGDVPAGASRGSLMATSTGAGRSAVMRVQSVTRWASQADLEAAQASEGYANAMRQLQTLFKSPPTAVEAFAEVAAWRGVGGDGGAAPPGGASAGRPEDGQQPGPELGLR